MWFLCGDTGLVGDAVIIDLIDLKSTTDRIHTMFFFL